MPQPQSDLTKIGKRKGPTPICNCGECLICKNRKRQQKWFAKQKALELLEEEEYNEDDA